MKKALAIVLALVMVFAMFAGCGEKPASTPNPTQQPSNPDPTKTPDQQPADPTDAPVDPVDTELPEWDGVSEPTHDNGNWKAAYEKIAKLAEDAKQYENVTPVQTFTLACHDPAESAPGEFLTAWADAVTVATEGAIDFNIGYSGVHAGTMQSLTAMIDGTVNFDWTLPCYFKGYMPLTNVIQNPALGIPNATVGSYAMWELYKNSPEIQAEFADDGELLFVWTNCTSPLSYKGTKEITSTAEIKGNTRGNNGPTQTFVAEVGAEVYGCPITDVYTNVSTGVISYLVTDWHGIKSFALSDPGCLNYYVDTNIGCSAYCLMANKDIWSLVEALGYADAIKSVSGDYLLDLTPIWNYWEAAGRYSAAQNGGTIFAPSEQLAAELNTAYENVAKTWISEQEDPAVAQSIYDMAKGYVDQFAAIYG